MSEKLKKYLNEEFKVKPVWTIFREMEEFRDTLDNWKEMMKGSIQSAAYADRLDSRERASVNAYKGFLKSIEEIQKELDVLMKGMRKHYDRDLDIGR